MADSTTNLTLIETSQSDKEGTANALFDAMSPASFFGRDDTTTLGLVWGYLGGRIAGTSVANGTLTLTGSRTNYVVVNKASGAVSVSTSGANWCTPGTYARLYKIVCSTYAITSYNDYRFGRGGVFGQALGGTVEGGRWELRLPLDTPSTSVTTGTRKLAFRPAGAVLLTDVRASVSTVSSSGTPTFDLNDGSDSVLGTKLTIDVSEKTSTTAATAFAFTADGAVLADDADMSIDVDTAGTSTAGAAFVLIGERGWGDPGWDLTTSALSLEGTNGGTTWTDAVSGRTWTLNGSSITTSTAQSLNATYGAFAASSTLFAGTTSWLSSDSSTDFNIGGGPFTVSFWMRLTSTANTPQMLIIGSASNNRIGIGVDTGTIRLYSETAAGGGAYRITGGSISTSTWYYVELTYDDTTATLWLDGVSQGTYTPGVWPSGTMQVQLGNYGYSPSSTYAVAGNLQRFRFTKGWARRTAAYSRPAKPFVTY